MQKNNSDKRKSVGLKIMPEIYEEIAEKAKRQHRTINNYMETILLKDLGKEGYDI